MQRLAPSTEFSYFVQNFLLKNEPCVFEEGATSNWKSRRLWQHEGKPNLAYLAEEFGNAEVPVADCSTVCYSSHSKSLWSLKDYLSYWEQQQLQTSPTSSDPGSPAVGSKQEQRLLYLKDWHFARHYPSYDAYTVLDAFQSDWLNEFCDQCADGVQDDYRFVYMGPKGTWTPFHADVFRSYSWSTNVCGQKEWLLFPPGEEEHLRDKLGNPPFDVTNADIRDPGKYPNAHKTKGPIRVIQNIGETIFVPSGWYHQVHNTEDTISINHNWTNGFGIRYMWRHLQSELQLVEKEISDCRDMEGWKEQCQLILKSSAGMNFSDFMDFLVTIVSPRLKQLEHIFKCTETTELRGSLELPDQLLLIVTRQSQESNTTSPVAGSDILVTPQNVASDKPVTQHSLLVQNLPIDIRRTLLSSSKWRVWNNAIQTIVAIRVYEISEVSKVMEGVTGDSSDISVQLLKILDYYY